MHGYFCVAAYVTADSGERCIATERGLRGDRRDSSERTEKPGERVKFAWIVRLFIPSTQATHTSCCLKSFERNKWFVLGRHGVLRSTIFTQRDYCSSGGIDSHDMSGSSIQRKPDTRHRFSTHHRHQLRERALPREISIVGVWHCGR